jgi:DNA-binding SARP family transcriptional activator
VAFLALEGACSREELVGRLWSDVPEDNARVSLRQTLYQLRRVLEDCGYTGLITEKLAVEIDRRTIATDVGVVLDQAEKEHRAHPLLLSTPRLSETLLAGLDDVDASFQDWLRARRQILHERLLRALEAGLHEQRSDRGIELAQAILNLDPTHEEACRTLMRARAEQGDVPGALKAYKALWDILAADYDMEPSTPTQQLVAEIKTGALEPPAPARSAQATRMTGAKIALALDAFKIDSVGADSVHLVHGFRHHLVGCLVRFRQWYVTDRVSQQVPDPSVSSKYDIQATAFGTKAGVKLLLTLKQSDSDIYIWTDTYELALERWFETQQEVVRRIATALNVHISQERLDRLSGQPDVSLDAYDRWLRGQAVITSFSSEAWKSAEQLFRNTIREAPKFSPAYSSLAQINNLAHITQPGIYRTRRRADETMELSRTAVRLDPLDSRAHLALGWAYMMSNQQEHAPTHFALACQLNDSDPWTLISASLAHSFSGSFKEARKLAKAAFELSLVPKRTMWGYQVTSRFLWGDYEGCLEAGRHAGDAIINMPAWTAAAMSHLGRHQQAREEARRFIGLARSAWQVQASPSNAEIVGWLLHSFPILKRKDWERLRDGLRTAGLPVGNVEHDDCSFPRG